MAHGHFHNNIATAARLLFFLLVSFISIPRSTTSPQSGGVRPSLALPAPVSSALPFSSLTWGQNSPKAGVEVGAARIAVAAVRRPAVDGIVEPAAAADHAVRACSSTTGVAAPCIRRAIPIPAPLEHITRHVIQAISVHRKTAHRRRARVGSTPKRMVTVRPQIVGGAAGSAAVVRQVLVDLHAPWQTLPAQTTASRLFPFRFRWQAIPARWSHQHFPSCRSPPARHSCNTPASFPPARSAHCTTSRNHTSSRSAPDDSVPCRCRPAGPCSCFQ